MKSILMLLSSMVAAGSWGILIGTDAITSSQPLIATQTPDTVFRSDHDRDNFIMQLSSNIVDMKNSLASLLKKFPNKAVDQSWGGGVSVSVFVAFMVRLTPRLSHLGKGQIIRFDDVVVNRGHGYDVRLGVFRCPVAGTYEFSLAIGSFGGIQLDIVNNGNQIGRVFTSRSRFGRSVDGVAGSDDGVRNARASGLGSATPSSNVNMSTYAPVINVHSGSEAHPSSTQTVVDLRVGDEVWVEHSTENQHDILFGGGMTTFSGHLLSPA